MLAICRLTLRRLKEPALIMLFFIGAVFSFMVSGSGVFEFSEINGGQAPELSHANSIYLGTVLLCGLGLLVTMFNAAAEIPRDISSRMISILLSKPISRLEYIAGKFLGAMGIGLLYTGLWLTIMLICKALFHEPNLASPLTLASVCHQYLCLLLLPPVTAIAIGFSCCFSDVVAMILTAIYVIACFGAAIVPIIACLSPFLLKRVILLGYLFFPNLCFFLQSYAGFWANLAIFVYAAATSLLFLLLGKALFNAGDVF